MRKKLMVEKIEKRNERLWLISNDSPFSLEHAKPKNHMLVDSDNIAFIYILETEEDFIYVTIPYEHWTDMKQVLTESIPVFLQSGTAELELTNFKEELAYLIENIDGNANYGEQMEQTVKEIFLT